MYSVYDPDDEENFLGHTITDIERSVNWLFSWLIINWVIYLDKYFPARPQIGIFIKKLHAWIHQHEDAVR